jgi:polar amino acid transport system substrate-binding protein
MKTASKITSARRPATRSLEYVFATLLCTTLVFVSLPVKANQLDKIKARGSLIVGVSDTLPPFSFRQHSSGDIIGYDIDLVGGVAKRLGVSLKPVSVQADKRIAMLLAGQIDLVATSLTRSLTRATRQDNIDFSLTYFISKNATVVKKSSFIRSAQDLRGRNVSTAETSLSKEDLDEPIFDVNIVFSEDLFKAIGALAGGAVDAIIGDELVLKTILQRDGSINDYRFLPAHGTSREVGFAIKAGEPALKEAVNEALLYIESIGEAAKIFDKWFGAASTTPMHRAFHIRRE